MARRNSVDRILTVGTDVSVGETIVTGPSGQVQIVFDDETRLVVGPGSSLLIEQYLLASNNTAEKLAINALGGSFRFITGNSPKPAYSIQTPTAAIAVRGTEFDLLVGPSGTGVLLYEGALQLCGATGDCQELVDRCDLGVASTAATERLVFADPAYRPLARQFRFARFQSGLLDDFRIGGAIFCTEERAQFTNLPLSETTGGGPTSPPDPVEPPPRPTPQPTPEPTPEPFPQTTPVPVPPPQSPAEPMPVPIPAPVPPPQAPAEPVPVPAPVPAPPSKTPTTEPLPAPMPPETAPPPRPLPTQPPPTRG